MSHPDDTFGLLPIPVTVDTSAALGDPALTKMLAAFAAVLNAHGSTAWGTTGQPTVPVVKTVYPHNPEHAVFAEKALPALYLYRLGAQEPPFQLTDDVRLTSDMLRLLWVPSSASQEHQRIRAPFANAVVKILDNFIHRTRDASWVDAGDTDPRAAAEGSILVDRAKLFSLKLGKWESGELQIAIEGGDTQRYQALVIPIMIEEHEDVGGFDALTGAELAIQNADPDPAVLTYATVNFPAP